MNPSITTEPMTSGRIQQMNSLIKAEPTTPGRIQQISTRIVFFIAGIGMAAWAPLVPFAKARAQIEDGMLGLLLLCVGAGSIIRCL